MRCAQAAYLRLEEWKQEQCRGTLKGGMIMTRCGLPKDFRFISFKHGGKRISNHFLSFHIVRRLSAKALHDKKMKAEECEHSSKERKR